MANEQTTVPLFVAAEILTAVDMNLSAGTGVPVFTNSTTRDAGFGGAGEKVLAEGQLCYLSDSNIVQYYSGASWATVGPTSSKIAQVLSTTLTTQFTRNSSTFADITGLTVAITPTLNTSKIYVTASLMVGTDNAVAYVYAKLARGGTEISGAVATSTGSRIATTSQVAAAVVQSMGSLSMQFLDSPASTSALTYSVLLSSGTSAGAVYINSSNTDTNSNLFARAVSTITVMEVLA